MAVIPPRDLNAAASVSDTDVLIVDKGSSVEKALPSQIVDAAIPLASQAEAEAGTDNDKRVSPLRVAQAISALGVSSSALAAGLAPKADTTYVDTQLAGKASTASVAAKADTTYVDAQLATKASTTALAAKADTTYVDTQLAGKASTASVAAKADTSMLAASTGATTIGYGSRTVAQKLGDVVSVKDFGAVGDGSTDDTTAIQAALNSSAKVVVFPEGSYRVANDGSTTAFRLTSSLAGRIIRGPGTLTATSRVKRLLQMTGAGSRVEGLRVDGNGFISDAIQLACTNPVITGCTVENLDGKTDWSAFAIRLNLDGLDTEGEVSNNTVRNLQAAGNATPGDGVGMTRAVLVNTDANRTKKVKVAGNRCYQIEGEEGDSIVVQGGDSITPYTFPVIISDNVIDLWSRRAIKVQANGVRVLRNELSNDRPSALDSLQRAIDFVSGSDHVCAFNTLTACKYQTQIGAFHSPPTVVDNIAVIGNIVRGIGAETTSDIFSLKTYGNGVIVKGNDVQLPAYTGTAVKVNNATGGIVEGNTVQTATAIWYDFTSSTGLRLGSNTVAGEAEYNSYYDLGTNRFVFDVSSGRVVELYNRDTVLNDGEIVAKIAMRQNDNGNPNTVTSSIGFIAEGSSGATGIAFYTSSDIERLRIRTNGRVHPSSDNSQNLGDPSFRWATIYAGTGTINTSDEREKEYIEDIPAEWIEIWKTIPTRRYKWRDGDDDRWHVGLVAQDIVRAFEAHGIDALEMGFVSYEEDRYGVNYAQASMMDRACGLS